MSQIPNLAQEDWALVHWCRWVRDWPILSLLWAGTVVTLFIAGIWTGFSPVILPLAVWLVLGWLAARIQRMAVLIDQLARLAATEEAKRLAGAGGRADRAKA